MQMNQAIFSGENDVDVHGFFYYFSFSVIIPTYKAYIDDFEDHKDFYGL